MVGMEFFSEVGSLASTGVEDFADRFNFMYTILVFSLCTAIVTVKQYILNPITCYISTEVGGSNVLNYVENYCWVQGTLPIAHEGRMPTGDDEWKALDGKKILYYQWVPFVLGIQCILFYVPKLIWQTVCYNETGIDLEIIMSKSADAATQTCPDTRQGVVAEIAFSIQQLLVQQHRREKQEYSKVRNRSPDRKSSHSCPSIKLGTASCLKSHIVFTYLCVKVLCVINSIGQLLMMQHFLGFNDTAAPFGIRVLMDLIKGHDWQETQIFPRTGFCYVRMKIMGVQTNALTAQCALPVNMLNEKIYIFLWWWILMVCIMSLYSLLMWLARNSSRWQEANYILKYIKLAEITDPYSEPDVVDFCQLFLRRDGMFILRMIRINSGDIIASEVIKQLWEQYVKRRNDNELDALNNKRNSLVTMPMGPVKSETSDDSTEPNAPSQIMTYPNLESQIAPDTFQNINSNIFV